MNPASLKQALVHTARRLPDPNLFEQGAGLMRLEAAAAYLRETPPRATLLPPELDLTAEACPYMWPFCRQPLYAGAMPVVINVTVMNALSATGYIVAEPRWVPGRNGTRLTVEVRYPAVLWPWGGYLAVYIRAAPGGGEAPGAIEEPFVASFGRSPTCH